MSKVKNRSTFRVLSLLLVVALISTVMLSGTFAKYTSEYAGQDTALVAKWAFKINDEDAVEGDTQDLELFKHLYDKNINQKDGNKYIIAPGVKGDFTLSITNKSDVAAEIAFAIEDVNEIEVPMKFKYNEQTYNDLDALVDALNAAKITIAEDEDGNGVTENIEVEWEWPYYVSDTQDGTDTTLGEDSAEGDARTEYTLEITVTATQIEPE